MKLNHALLLQSWLLSWPIQAMKVVVKRESLTMITSIIRHDNGTSSATPGTPIIHSPSLIPSNITTPSTEECTPFGRHAPFTVYEIKHTETITFTGREEDYTPPYEQLTLPIFCEFFTTVPAKGSDQFITATFVEPPARTTDGPVAPRETITIVTTDKNPAVVFTASPPPRFTQTGPLARPLPPKSNQDDGGTIEKVPARVTLKPDDPSGNEPSDKVPDRRPNTSEQRLRGPTSNIPQLRPPFTVSVGDDKIIINNSTFDNLQPSRTSTVTVDEGTFTIRPTAILGEGATVSKPAPRETHWVIPKPTGATLDGVHVTVSGSQAIIGGTPVAIPTAGITTVIDGKPVSVGPDGVAVGDNSLSYTAKPPKQTDEVVLGGTPVRAIGSSILVIHSTTFTYGPGIPKTSEVVDGETIGIGPDGVVIHGTTIGGTLAKGGATAYDVLGGVTITPAGPSAVAIEGVTYTLGSGRSEMTTVIHSKTVTIGPSDIRVSTETYTIPLVSDIVTTIKPARTTSSEHPVETGSKNSLDKKPVGEEGDTHEAPKDEDKDEDEDDKNAAALIRPYTGLAMLAGCASFGFLFAI